MVNCEFPSTVAKVRRWLGRLLVLAAIVLGSFKMGFHPDPNELLIITALLFVGAGLIGRIDQLTWRQLLQDISLRSTNALMHNVVESSFDGVLLITGEGVIEKANPAAARIFAFPLEEMSQRRVATLLPEVADDAAAVDAFFAAARAPREVVGQRSDGETFPLDFVVNELKVNDRRLFVAILRDITDRKAQQEQLEYLALHDGLTGLANRMRLKDDINDTLKVARHSRQPFALLLLDLDRFKEINDTLGHQVGDALLVEVGQRLSNTVAGVGTVARLGGDEFAVLLPVGTESVQAEDVAKHMIEVLQVPFNVDGLTLEIGVSIGVALYPEHGEDTSRLLRSADVAMYIAKREQSMFALYDSERDHNSVRNLAMSGELRQAIETDQLSLYYQPQIDLASGRVVGVEALVRWNHPEHGFVLPEEFVSVAEHMGLIQPLTHWVLDSALRQAAAWRSDGLDIGVSVNLSSRNLHEEDLPETVAQLLDSHGVEPGRLTLELTESALIIDPARALGVIERLSIIGVRLGIDDFGTGYSSLAYLKRLPVDELKIDKSFVIHMTEDGNDAVIVRSTVDLAHNLGLKVVAEGVEGDEQLHYLEALGCDLGQGHFVSRPLPVEDFAGWLEASPWRANSVQSQVDTNVIELPETWCWSLNDAPHQPKTSSVRRAQISTRSGR
ncbi:MAG: putative bifunctional diguanylate cyclase/phosphodiesterase [Alphaproteobacteria bacterium]